MAVLRAVRWWGAVVGLPTSHRRCWCVLGRLEPPRGPRAARRWRRRGPDAVAASCVARHAIDATPARRRGGVVAHRSIQPAPTCAPASLVDLRTGDYAQKLRGVGPKTALKLIVTHKSLERAVFVERPGVAAGAEINATLSPSPRWRGVFRLISAQVATKAPKGKVLAPEGWDFQSARRIFSTEVLKGDPHVAVAFSEPDYEGFRAFLVDTNGFSAERVEAMVKRLRKVRAKKPQRRIDDFVKAKPAAASRHFASEPAPPVAPTAPQPSSAPTTPRPSPASRVDPRTLLPVKPEYVGPPTAGGSSSSDDESSGERTEAYPHSPARNESLAVGAAVEVVGVSNAEFNGRRGVVAETPPELVARERVLVTVDGRTVSLKRRNVVAVAARPASPAPQPAPPPPTPTKTSTQPAAARSPPPPPPSATPTKKSPALAKFLAGGVRDTTPVKKKRGSAKALSSPPPKKSKKKQSPATASLAADFFSGKVKDATKPPKKKARKKKGGPGPCARAGAAPAAEEEEAEEESLAAGVAVVNAEDLLATAGDSN